MQEIIRQAPALANSAAKTSVKAAAGLGNEALRQTDVIAGKLDNAYTQDARAQLAMGGAQTSMLGQAANTMQGYAGQAAGDIGGTQIENQLRMQAEQELALGRALSPEQERAATLAARQGFAARGMAMGNPSAMAEILNRDAYASQRENERRQFALGTNQALTQNRLARLGLAGQLTGQEGALRQGVTQSALGMAGGYTSTDPYQRALGSNLPMGAMQSGSNLVGNVYQGLMGYAADVNNTNLNMQASMYNSYLNNQAAMKGAAMQSAASGQAGMMGMAGAGIGAVAMIGGAVII